MTTQPIYIIQNLEKRCITSIYTEEPPKQDGIRNQNLYKMEVNKDDIPYLRITRKCYYSNSLPELKRAIIGYLHSIGKMLDYHPEIGTDYPKVNGISIEEWLNKKSKYISYDMEYLRVVKEPTTCIFYQALKKREFDENASIVFEKVSSVRISLDTEEESGFFIENDAAKLYGLLVKEPLTRKYYYQQPCICAFSYDISHLEDLNINPKYEYVIKEILVIGWIGEIWKTHKFYGILNDNGCEGVAYTDDPEIFGSKYPNENISFSENPIEMNVFYDEGILNG